MNHSYELYAHVRTKSVTYNETWVETNIATRVTSCDAEDPLDLYLEIGNNFDYAMFANALMRNIVDNIE